ncbi:MAG: hypothetical protein KBT63_07935 [Porticoccaceae bacterium]|nr:hypothetical protein [Porticoccaceae bacterium]
MNIDKDEYEVLKFAYEEWAKINRIIATFSFLIIGFTIAGKATHISVELLAPEQKESIRTALVLFGLSGLAAGFNMCVAYIWMDAIRRNYKKSLIGKTVIGSYPAFCLKLGSLGWILSIFSICSIIYGIYKLMDIALVYLAV